jgi:hypothetical protein
MDHTRATATGAAERYVLGDMTPQERDDYEAHFFDCAECADEVKNAAVFLDNAKPLLVNAEPARWPGSRASFVPLPFVALAAAVVFVVAGYQALVVVPNLRDQLRDAQRLQPASWHFLSVSRGDAPVITVTGRERIGVTLSRSFDRSFPFYLCEVRDATGRVVLSEVIPAARPGDELQILLPTDGLQSGRAVIAVAGLESASNRTPATDYALYPFTLERRAP